MLADQAAFIKVSQNGTEGWFKKDDAVALSFGGLALAFVTGDCQGGVALIDRALVLNPNLASAWNASGWVRAFLGETELAIEHVVRAMRLSPLDPLMFMMHHVIGLAHFVAGNYCEASSYAAKASREQPTFVSSMRVAAASYALSGQLVQAQELRSFVLWRQRRMIGSWRYRLRSLAAYFQASNG